MVFLKWTPGGEGLAASNGGEEEHTLSQGEKNENKRKVLSRSLHVKTKWQLSGLKNETNLLVPKTPALQIATWGWLQKQVIPKIPVLKCPTLQET